LPLEWIVRPGEVERVQHVWVRGHDIQRVAHDEWLALVAAQHARGEGPHWPQPTRVGHADLGHGTVARGRVIPGGHGPLAVLAGLLRRGGHRTQCPEAQPERARPPARHARPRRWRRCSCTSAVLTPRWTASE